MKLNDSQKLVLKHYCGGEFYKIETEQQLCECGDGLFVFLMREAQDAETTGDFWHMLETAITQLRSLQGELP